MYCPYQKDKWVLTKKVVFTETKTSPIKLYLVNRFHEYQKNLNEQRVDITSDLIHLEIYNTVLIRNSEMAQDNQPSF